MITLEQLRLALRTPFVKRAMIHPVIPQISIADHMLQVYALYKFFSGREDVATAFHDIEEVLTGDIPSPAKKYLQGLDYFEKTRPQFESDSEKKLSKLCDKLSLVIHIKPYVAFGENILQIYEDELEQVNEIAKELGKSKEVKKLLKELI